MALLALLFGFSLWSTSVASPSQHLAPYTNPIISGFAPDPSCIRVDEQYFCVTSSFSAFPGIPVYTSRDLVQWEQIGNVFSRPEQLPEFSQVNQSTGGMWAATIRHHNNKFFVTSTLVFDGDEADNPARWDNIIFTNDDIWSNNGNGWSDPVHFSFNGYDASLFWENVTDATGVTSEKVFVQASHSWRVFPAIQQFEIDLDTGNITSGDPVTIWTGTGGLAPEGPHLYKKDGFFYLLIAEGGTGLNHMVTMARATNIWGPYDPCPFNPVLTNANTTQYLQTVGHADVFQDTEDNWWSVSLATRNGTVNFPMGRETVLVPVVWDEGQFPVFNGGKPGRAEVHMQGPLPSKQSPTSNPTSGVLVGQDQHITFSPGSTLPRQLVYFRFPDADLYAVSPTGHPDTLRLTGSAENITGNGGEGTSTFIMRRQDHVEFTATVDLDFSPLRVGEEAGMSLFLQRTQQFDLGVVRLAQNQELNGDDDSGVSIRLRTIVAGALNEGAVDPSGLSHPGVISLPAATSKLTLKVQAVNASTYEFSFTPLGKNNWKAVGTGAASQVSGGFTGTLVGMFATGNGNNSISPAYFSNFQYNVNPNVF